jgi:integrase
MGVKHDHRNPCRGVDRNPTNDRERVLSDAEVATLWPKLDSALKLLLLTGQRPGEVAALQREHIVDGFWQTPGRPVGDWPGTKNSRDHRVALSKPALDLIEIHLADRACASTSSKPEEVGLRAWSGESDAARFAPNLPKHGHELAGRDAMDRIANHRKGGVDVTIATATRWRTVDHGRRRPPRLNLVDGTSESNVVALREARGPRSEGERPRVTSARSASNLTPAEA